MMTNFNEFLHMGGYGFYVWTCYALTLLIFLGLIVALRVEHRKIVRQLLRRRKRAQLSGNESGDNSPNDNRPA